jgi:hypothetical protein
MTTNTAPVKIDASLLERLLEYRNQTGIPVSRSVNEAIKDFLITCAPARLEAHGLSPLEISNFLLPLEISQNEKKLTLPRKKAS